MSPAHILNVKLRKTELDLFDESLRSLERDCASSEAARIALMEYGKDAGFDFGPSIEDSRLASGNEIAAFKVALSVLKDLLSKNQIITPKYAPLASGDPFPYKYAFPVPFEPTPSREGTGIARLSAAGELGQIIFDSEATGTKIFDKISISTSERPVTPAPGPDDNRSKARESDEAIAGVGVEALPLRRLAKGKQREERTPSPQASRLPSPAEQAVSEAMPDPVEQDAILAAALQREELKGVPGEEMQPVPGPSASRARASIQPAVRTDRRRSELIRKLFDGSSSDLSEEGAVRHTGQQQRKKPKIARMPAHAKVSAAKVSHVQTPGASTSASVAGAISASYAAIECHRFVQNIWAALPDDKKSAQAFYAVLTRAIAAQADGQSLEAAVAHYLAGFEEMNGAQRSAAITKIIADSGSKLSLFSQIKTYIDERWHGVPFIDFAKNVATFLHELPKPNLGMKADKNLSNIRSTYLAIFKLIFPLLPFQASAEAVLGNAAGQRTREDAFAVDEWMARQGRDPNELLEATGIQHVCELVKELRQSLRSVNSSAALVLQWRTERHPQPLDGILQAGLPEITVKEDIARNIRLCVNVLPCIAAIKGLSDREVLESLPSGGMKRELAEFLGLENLSGSRMTALKMIGEMQAVQRYLSNGEE